MKYTVHYISTCNSTVTASGTYEGTDAPSSAVYAADGVTFCIKAFKAESNQWIASFEGTSDCTGTVVLVP